MGYWFWQPCSGVWTRENRCRYDRSHLRYRERSQFNHFKNRSRCYGHVVSTRESAWPFRAAAVTNAEAKRANAQSGQRNQLHDR